VEEFDVTVVFETRDEVGVTVVDEPVGTDAFTTVDFALSVPGVEGVDVDVAVETEATGAAFG